MQLALPEESTATSLQRVIALFDGPVAWNETLPPVTGPEASVTVAEKLPDGGQPSELGPESVVVVDNTAGATASANGPEVDDASVASPE